MAVGSDEVQTHRHPRNGLRSPETQALGFSWLFPQEDRGRIARPHSGQGPAPPSTWGLQEHGAASEDSGICHLFFHPKQMALTTGLSPRSGEAGSTENESKNQPQTERKEKAPCQLLCQLEDAGSRGDGPKREQAGLPGRGRTSQRWDFQGSSGFQQSDHLRRWKLTRPSWERRGTDLHSTCVHVCTKEVKSGKEIMTMLPNALKSQTRFSLLRHACVNGSSR